MIAAGLFLALYSNAYAQNQMLVELTDGSTEVYPVSDIRSIKFVDATMVINLWSGNPVAFDIVEIDKYYFNFLNSTEGHSSVSNPLNIYPNPATDQIAIVYNSLNYEHISIDLMDATGRCIARPFCGEHTGKVVYKHPLCIAAGLYFCRVTSEHATITHPFAVH